MPIVDLTLPLRRTWRYPIEFTPVKSFANGDILEVTEHNLRSHWYTHIDAPRHFMQGGKTLDDFPLDILCGEALLLDLRHVGDSEPITAQVLADAARGFAHHDFVILRTELGKRHSWETTDFWDNAPYVTEDGAIWLRDYAPKVVGFDFPQDYDIRLLRFKSERECTHTCHEHILKHDILMIEYLTNLWNVPGPTCNIAALPLKTEHADGAQIRVVAFVD